MLSRYSIILFSINPRNIFIIKRTFLVRIIDSNSGPESRKGPKKSTNQSTVLVSNVPFSAYCSLLRCFNYTFFSILRTFEGRLPLIHNHLRIINLRFIKICFWLLCLFKIFGVSYGKIFGSGWFRQHQYRFPKRGTLKLHCLKLRVAF